MAAMATAFCGAPLIASDFYVATPGDNGSDANAGTAEAPFATIAHAVSEAGEGDVIHVANGSYSNDATVTLDKGVTISGESRDGVKVTAASGQLAFSVAHDNAAVRGLTILNCVSKTVNLGSGLAISAGLVENCVISNNATTGVDYSIGGVKMTGGTIRNCLLQNNGSTRYGAYGGNINMAGGTLDGCTVRAGKTGNTASTGTGISMSSGTVTNCDITANGTAQASGGGVYMTGGLVTHCRIHGNGNGRGSQGSAVRINGAGTLRNCLIYGNRQNGNNAAVNITHGSGVMRFCTIYGNVASGATSAVAGLQMTNGSATDNIIYGNGNGNAGWTAGGTTASGGTFNRNITDSPVSRGTANYCADPRFVDAANLDFHVLLGSPAIGNAAFSDAAPLDFEGTARSETAPTCGAYEFATSGGALQTAIVNLQNDFPEGGTPSASAMVAGDDQSGLTYAWYVDGALVPGQTSADATFPGLPPGNHTVRLVVSNGGGETAADEIAGAWMIYPLHVYVDAANAAGAAFPYNTRETAATTIDAAYDVLWKNPSAATTIDVAPGDYALTKTISLTTPVTFCGAGTNETRISAAAITSSAFYMTSAAAAISNIAINVGGVETSVFGGGIQMTAGLVADCVVTNVLQGSKYNVSGGGVYIKDGTIRGCAVGKVSGGSTGCNGGGIRMEGGTVSNCVVFSCSSQSGGGVRQAGGTLTHCVIRNCSNGAGLSITAGTAQNCILYGNTRGANAAAAIYNEGGTVRHCTVYGNVTSSDSTGYSGLQQLKGTSANNIFWGNGPAGGTAGSTYVTGGTFTSNVVDVAAAIGSSIVGDPKFVDAAAHDFHIGAASAARGAALRSTAAAVAFDFDGVARDAEAPSCGAYEYVATQELTAGIQLGAETVPLGTDATASAVIDGAASENLSYTWYLDGAAVAGQTGALAVFAAPAAGEHTVKVAVSDGTSAAESDEATFSVKPLHVYVVPESPSATPAFPYDTWATAATNLNDAFSVLYVAADATSRVDLAEGRIALTRGVAASTPVVIRGAGRDRTFIVGRSDLETTPTRVFRIGHPDAELSGLTISNFYFKSESELEDGAVIMTAGTVRDLHISRIRTTGHYYTGIGLFMTDGLAQDIEIDGCNCAGRTGRSGGLYIGGGLAERIVIHHCEGNITCGAAGAYVAGGTLRNALVYGCSTYSGGAVCGTVYVAGGKLLNSTVAGNSCSVSALPMVHVQGGASVVNTISWNEQPSADIGGGGTVTHSCYANAAAGNASGNISDNPLFKGAASRNYRLRKASPCVNAGSDAGWTRDDVDLAGNPRLRGSATDIGCFERPFADTLLRLR